MLQAPHKTSFAVLFTFIAFSILFYCVGYWLIFRLERATPLMMSVGAAAIVTCILYKRPLSSLGFSWGSKRYQWLSFLIPLGVVTASYLLIWVFGLGQFNTDFVASLKDSYNLADWNSAEILLFHFFLSATFTLILSLPSILGEEIAWRGLLVQELSKSFSFTNVALITGALWAIFHLPLMFRGFYGAEHTPFYFQLGFFTLFVISNSVTMTYLRYKTNSVWSGVLFHASSNVFVQKVFTPLTIVDQQSSWYVDEFGVVVPLVAAALALYFWQRARQEFPGVQKQTSES